MKEINRQKAELRKIVKEKKSLIPFEKKIERSGKIFEKLERKGVFQKAKTIMLYWSMKDEVHTHDFIMKYFNQKQIILPAVNGDKLELKVFEGMETMEPGEGFGILEPTGKTFAQIDEIDLIIVPGVAFDKQNNRLGRGRAYYDKLLKLTKALKIGICFSFQFFEEVPTDQYDIKMDLIISE